MLTPNFFIDNYVSNYKIISYYNRHDKFIVSNTPALSKHIASQNIYYNTDSLALAFANINLNNFDEILLFCNTYGLPFSSKKCLDLRKKLNSTENSVSFLFDNLFLNDILNDEDYIQYDSDTKFKAQLDYWQKDISDEDIMPLILFNRCVKIVRSILTIHNWLIKKEGSVNNIIHNLAYLILYAFRGTEYLTLQEATTTIKFSKFITQNSNTGIVLKSNTNHAYWLQLKEFIDNLDDKTLKNINDYDIGILNSKDFNSIIEAEATSSDKIDPLFAQKVIYDIINNGISMATPKICISNKKPVQEWNTAYLMNGIYLDVYYNIIYADSYKKCRNPQCGKYFLTTGRRSDAVYCSNKCASKMAKQGKFVRINKI